ncbi:MAG: LysR family transcriptional regulator [Corynebacterium variabile]|nr:LysR family transcriptional regulator [Corynebacterium variabile]MDN6813132.1 LysR family transcriptional regulator [Corynebacterium variabile]
MDVNELELFIAVAESHSVSAAAERLHTVQSNVSARLRALETKVGTPLAGASPSCSPPTRTIART